MAMTPLDRVNINSKTIETVYREYLTGTYRVNRRYQRKLVWTIEEKSALIDSILKQYPLPQFLVAEDVTAGVTYEIIDGMQRMNAIIAFLENEFSLDGKFFDLASIADTKAKFDQGELQQREPKLSREDSVSIATYNIAQSVYQTNDTQRVEDVFRRINSSGQKLSRQDLRQAGTVSPVSDVVREIATRIRGDVTRESVVQLGLMSKLSIATGVSAEGISPDTTFWVKHGILNRSGLRSSADEQLVLDIVIDMLVNPYPKTGTPARDAIYGFEGAGASTEPPEADLVRIEAIKSDPAWKTSKGDELTRNFFEVWDCIDRILGTLPEGVRLVRHIGLRANNPIPRYFEAIFMAIHELVVGENHGLSDAGAAANALEEINSRMKMPGGGGEWAAADKSATIRSVRRRLAPAFQGVRQAGISGSSAGGFITESNVRDILNMAIAERSSLECKQGLLSLEENPQWNSELAARLVKTLAAISNTHPTTGGHLIIGIADRPEHVARMVEVDPSFRPVTHRNFSIVGIEREAVRLGLELGSYWNDRILRAIQSNTQAARAYLDAVIRTSALAHFGGLVVAVLTAPPIEAPIRYGADIVVRNGSNNETLRDSALESFLLGFHSRR